MEMQRRKFSREFKVEAVKLVRERGVSVSQAARDLDLHENVLRKWVREQEADPGSAFPGHGVLKPEQQEIERLRRELARMKAERDILKRMARPIRKGFVRDGIIGLHQRIRSQG
jgi:transposase